MSALLKVANSMAAPPSVPEQPPTVARALVLKPHRAGDSSQLELAVNDIVCVLEKDASGWWGGHKENEETTGWFPGSCVREIIEKDISLPPSSVMSPLPGERSVLEPEDSPGNKDGKDARERRLSPVWKRITRESSPGFSHTVDIEFSRKSDDRFQSIQLIRPSSPASSIASGVQSLPTGSDANREVKRLRDLVAELRHVKRQCDTEIRQLRNNASQQETEAAATRAENARLEQQLRVAGQREELLMKEVETLRQEVQQEKQSSKQLKQELDEKSLELKLVIQAKEDPWLKNTTTEKPFDSLETSSAKGSTVSAVGSAEALRKRLFPASLASRSDAGGTAPFASVSRAEREDDLQSLSSATPSGIATHGGVTTSPSLSEKVPSPQMRQSEPRQASSTVSTMDETLSSTLSSTTSTAAGFPGQRPSPYPSGVNVPRPIGGAQIRGGSMNLPMGHSSGLSPAPLKRVGAAPPSRAVYTPGGSPSMSPSSMTRNSINGMRAGQR
mmetsp:Transcript_97631/g.172932  ORF Transcript_97631/g.172932 Transcript_97631/m.172932 type:complete len:501 (+) Transcript_97631:135-1637(+)